MTDTGPIENGRGSNGRFAAGNRLGGRTKGARHQTTMAIEALLEGEADGLTRKAIEMALEGDTVALRLCLERLAPVRKDAPIHVDLPPVDTAEDMVTASASVLASVAAAEITPSEGGQLMALLTAHRSIIEVGELEKRVTALEGARS